MEDNLKFKLEKIVKQLGSYRGRHTELVTVYVPAEYNLNLIAKQVDAEKSTAMNIKSKNTRKNVLDALERISRHLKLYKGTPKNGLAIFCGNISETEGQPQIEIWAVEPPQPLRTKLYRCDQTFVLEPLKEMLEVSEVYGLVVVERKEATIGILEGKNIRTLQKMTSDVPGKYKTGGQSAPRFERIREGKALEFYRRIAEAVKKHFFNMPKLKGILVGGPGPTKEEFLRDGELTTALKDKVIAVKDIGYSDEHGLGLLVGASQDVLAQQEITLEKEILKKFFTLLATKPEIIAYGKADVERALKLGAVSELFLSTTLQEKEAEEFENLAINISAIVHFISEDTDEGLQFKNIGGFGAILRFKID